jgi:hypothetical protein
MVLLTPTIEKIIFLSSTVAILLLVTIFFANIQKNFNTGAFLRFFLCTTDYFAYFCNIRITNNNKGMVKHIILWTLNPELSEAEKQQVKAGIKAGLEGLVGKVPGLLDVKVHIDGRLASSNADVMLDSTLESEEALKGYAVHPEHVAVANGKVRPYTVQRSCLDFEI